MATKEDIIEYVAKVQAGIDAEWNASDSAKHFLPPLLTIQFGKKNAKIARTLNGGKDEFSRSVHHFVDMGSGAILKAASWNTPAKGARGNIATFTYGEEVGLYGAAYR